MQVKELKALKAPKDQNLLLVSLRIAQPQCMLAQQPQ